MSTLFDLIVIGGGPAGTAAAITAARAGAEVLLLEGGRLPRQKVCGEFVSAEAAGPLRSLLTPRQHELLDAVPRITCARIHAVGRTAELAMRPPGTSISRYDLDWSLWCAAESAGADVRQKLEVEELRRHGQEFEVRTASHTFAARAIIDAAGRASKVRREQGRTAMSRGDGTRWIGLKAHFACDPPETEHPHHGGFATDLYFLPTGYCGVQATCEREVNVCAMVRAGSAARLAQVIAANSQLHARSQSWQLSESALATGSLAFGEAVPAFEGVLRAGDAAGFIDPFVGDGISLALRSGILAAETLRPVWRVAAPLDAAAEQYRREYLRRFSAAFRTSAWVRRLLSAPDGAKSLAMQALRLTPVANFVIGHTR